LFPSAIQKTQVYILFEYQYFSILFGVAKKIKNDK